MPAKSARAPLGDVDTNARRKPKTETKERVNTDAQKPAASRKRKSDGGDKPEGPKKVKAAKDDKTAVPDISGIKLDGEDARAVEVYDTCDMIRSKIKLFMKQHPKESNASLARRLGVSANGLSRFCGKKGYDKGSTSAAFYEAYVFFEKLRIAQDKPKSKDRVKMEEIWAHRGGFDITRASNHKYISMPATDHITGKNKYGEWTITRANGKQQTGAL